MPFKKGHKYYPAKDPESRRGERHPARRTILFAAAVQERVEAAVLVEFQIAVAKGLPNVRLDEDEDGDLHVVWDDVGPSPSLEEKSAAIRELTNRGHGQAPQAHYIEQSVRMHLSGSASVDARMIGGQTPIMSMLEAYRAAQARLAEPASASLVDTAKVIDAESTESSTEDSSEPEDGVT